jgi:hypothetical protein
MILQQESHFQSQIWLWKSTNIPKVWVQTLGKRREKIVWRGKKKGENELKNMFIQFIPLPIMTD